MDNLGQFDFDLCVTCQYPYWYHKDYSEHTCRDFKFSNLRHLEYKYETNKNT